MPEYQVKATNLPDDEFLRGYLECAEWVGIMPDEGNEEFDNESLDSPEWSRTAIASAEVDCASFKRDAGTMLDDIDESRAGHDFWLTRNGHGAGFWDRGLGRIGDKLTALCKPYGEAHVWFDPDSNTLHLES